MEAGSRIMLRRLQDYETTRQQDYETTSGYRPTFRVAERLFAFFAIYELFSRYNEL